MEASLSIQEMIPVELMVKPVSEIKPFVEQSQIFVKSTRTPTQIGSFHETGKDKEKKTVLIRKEGDRVRPNYTESYYMGRNYTEVKLTDELLRREYILMKLYKEMGLPVPNVELQTVDGKTALLIDDLGWAKSVDLDNEKLSETQKSQLQTYHFISFWLKNPSFLWNLVKKGDDLILTNAIVTDPHMMGVNRDLQDVLPKNSLTFDTDSYDQRQKFKKRFRTPLQPTEKEYFQAAAMLRSLEPTRIAQIVKDSGLSVDKVRGLISDFLERRDRVLNLIFDENEEDVLVNSDEWEKLDGLLEETPGNASFRTMAEKARKISSMIEGIGGVLQIVKSKWSKEQLKEHQSEKPERASVLIKHLKTQPVSADILLKIKTQIEIARAKYPNFVFRAFGYSSAERELISRTSTLERDLSSRVMRETEDVLKFSDYALRHFYRRFDDSGQEVSSISYTAGEERFNKLEHLLAPTLKQIKEFEKLIAVLQSDLAKNLGVSYYREIREGLDLDFKLLKRRRGIFKQSCELRSRSLVSHLGVPESVIGAVKSGFIESSMKQDKKRKVVHIGSPGGERRLLPDISFAVAAADIGYGGKVSKQQIERGKFYSSPLSSVKYDYDYSVGWVGSYDMVTNGMFFAETVNTSGDLHQELHLFDPKYTDSYPEGAEISIDSLRLVVSEKEKEQWQKTLLENGKSKDWIASHLVSYPEWLDINTFIRYFVKPADVGYEAKPGIFTTDMKHEARVLLRDEKPYYLFSWITV